MLDKQLKNKHLKCICHANGDKVHRLYTDTYKELFQNFLNTEVTAHSNTTPGETFLGSILPSQRCVDKSRGRSFNGRAVSPGDACLTPNRGYTASPSLFHFNTRDGLREEGMVGGRDRGRDNETEREVEREGGSPNRSRP